MTHAPLKNKVKLERCFLHDKRVLKSIKFKTYKIIVELFILFLSQAHLSKSTVKTSKARPSDTRGVIQTIMNVSKPTSSVLN